MVLLESLFDGNFNLFQVSWQYSKLFLEANRMQYLQHLFGGGGRNWMNMDWHKTVFTVGSAQPDKMANRYSSKVQAVPSTN